MPNTRKYNWETKEEEKECRKKYDREQKFINFWAKNYNLNIKVEDIELVKEYKKEIKKLLPVFQFIQSLELIN